MDTQKEYHNIILGEFENEQIPKVQLNNDCEILESEVFDWENEINTLQVNNKMLNLKL